jgi:uncharacterized protein YndB with AHSA1/START domain
LTAPRRGHTTAETQIVAAPGVPQIVITRRFAAPPALLLRAHIEPDLLVRWLGPRRLTLTVDLLDARHGGMWRQTHRDSDGAAYVFHGLYHGTPSPEGIVQTYEAEAMPGHVFFCTTTFEGRDGGTLLRQNTVFQSVDDRDGYVAAGMEEGVHESMERLTELVATLTPEV